MPRDESLQHKLDRVRPPRVQITYDVEIGDAEVKKELPFVLGVLADLSGTPDPKKPQLPLKHEDRKFVEINRDTFNRVMKGMNPRLAMRVDNKLQNDGSKLGVDLKFQSINDFEPSNVVQQVDPLRKLLEARQRLTELKSKVVTNDQLDAVLQRIIHNTDELKKLGSETGRTAPAPAAAAEQPAPADGEA
jgi:type VI secretion system protein ImpB